MSKPPRLAPTVVAVTSPSPTLTRTSVIGNAHPRLHRTRRRRSGHRRQDRLRTRPVAPSTPAPRPTPVRPHTYLNVENTIRPVTCVNTATADARPFLIPPYHGFTPVFSYFDHDLPDFTPDGQIDLANGAVIGAGASAWGMPHAADFPAYWSDTLRQYIYYDGHNGYDFGLSYQPVYAAAAGRVIFAGWNYPDAPAHGYGQMIMINHGHGYVTLYGHLSRLMVTAGDRVTAGQQIGISGNTGHSSGPHLHFSVFHNCTPTDPFGWVGTGTDPLTGYEGEASTYLWLRPPLMLDVLPGWPGLSQQLAPPEAELINLTLPQATRLPAFLHVLDRERRELGHALRERHIHAKYDSGIAAFRVTHAPRAATLYALPGIASITTAHADDTSLDQASYTTYVAHLLRSVKPSSVAAGGPWHAFTYHQGRQVFLLGYGPAERTAQLLLMHHSTLTMVQVTSTGSGAFAVPLDSSMARHTRIVLLSHGRRVPLAVPGTRRLSPRRHAGTPPPRPLRTRRPSARSSRHVVHGSTPLMAYLLPALFILGGACLALWRFRLAPPSPPPTGVEELPAPTPEENPNE